MRRWEEAFQIPIRTALRKSYAKTFACTEQNIRDLQQELEVGTLASFQSDLKKELFEKLLPRVALCSTPRRLSALNRTSDTCSRGWRWVF